MKYCHKWIGSVFIYETLAITQKSFSQRIVPDRAVWSPSEESECGVYNTAHFSVVYFQESFPLPFSPNAISVQLLKCMDLIM